jgi:hypothetical protein
MYGNYNVGIKIPIKPIFEVDPPLPVIEAVTVTGVPAVTLKIPAK